MARRRPRVSRLVAAAVLTVSTACSNAPGGLRVAAAASLGEVVDALEVEADLGGSATLARQILDGSPADVFLAADRTTMQTVVDGGLAVGAPVLFARNGLVLVVPAQNPAGIRDLTDFGRRELRVGRCADDVPCGRLALEELAESGVADVADTEEPDVRSLLAKVEAGELDVGLVYRSDVVAASGRVTAVEDQDLDRRNDYVAVAIAGGDTAQAEAFLERLLGPEGRAALERWGFELP